MHVKEEDILLPRKSSISNPDDWPTFNIKRIRVTSQKTGQEVSLLSANTANPVRVSGSLDKIDDDLLYLVRDKRYKDKTIELSNVMTYAFAEYDDGTYGFWAAGKAGWFEIQSPANVYKDIYDKMNEAASIHYMLADKFKKSHNRRPKLTQKALEKHVNRIFQDYIGQGPGPQPLGDVDDVREAFHEHREFLITSMLEDQEGLNWDQSPMLNYFTLTFPEDVTRIKARLIGKGSAPVLSVEEESDRPKKRKSPSTDTGSNPVYKRKRGRPKSSEVEPPHTPATKSIENVSSSGDERVGNPNVLTRKQKSILRPSGGKSSKKMAARRKGPAAFDEPSNDLEDEDDDGSQSAAEESPITTIRNAKDLDLLTNAPSDRSSPHEDAPKFLPRKYLELKVVEYDLPSTEPQGPGDLWTCTFEGCYHRVHEASTVDGKKRIKEHFKTHALSAQEKIDLVVNESRPYLPVNNLMRRLQAFASAPDAEPGPDSLERTFSAAIRKKY